MIAVIIISIFFLIDEQPMTSELYKFELIEHDSNLFHFVSNIIGLCGRCASFSMQVFEYFMALGCLSMLSFVYMQYMQWNGYQAISMSFESFILTRMPCHKMFRVYYIHVCVRAWPYQNAAYTNASTNDKHCIECHLFGIFMSQSANMNIVSFYSLLYTILCGRSIFEVH